MRPDNRNRPARNGAAPRSGWQAAPSVCPEPCVTADQLTIEDALRARDRGLEVATWATDVQWREAFDAALARWAVRGVEFVSDDVLADVGPPIGSANAVGARMCAAARAGVIRRVGYRQSSRPSRQGGVVAVWRGAS